MSQEKPFTKVSPTEYEIKLGGKTKLIKAPFAVTEKLFKCYISGGGIINDKGEVTTDIITLISSFKEIGNLLLSEFSDVGAVITEGNCTNLSTTEVIALFTLSTEIIQDFIMELASMQKAQPALVPNPVEDEKENLTNP